MADVTIYQDINFGGPSQQLAVGEYDVTSLLIGNDQLTSLQIPAGIKVTLFEDAGFTGKSKVFTTDTPYVGDDFNDITSSIKIEGLVTIYQDAYFQGASQQLGQGDHDINSLQIGNDQLSSLQVPDGLIVTLFADAGFQGVTKTFTADTEFVGSDFNDLTSSIRIGNVTDAITIYQDAYFGGASQVLTPGLYDLNSLQIGNDQLSSIKIPLGLRVTLFADENFQGNTKTFTADTPFVGADFNDLTSSIDVAKMNGVKLSGSIWFPGGAAVTSQYTIRMDENGNVTFALHVHDSSKFETYDYGVIVVVVTPDKTAYTFEHQGHVANVFAGGVHDDNPVINTNNAAIATNWQQILQATAISKGTSDAYLLGEGWEQTAVQVAETVGEIIIKIIGSDDDNGGGSGGDGGDN